MSQSVLVVAPHPDDEVLGCGGTMARHADAGDEVHVLIMTKGDPDLYPDDDPALLGQDIRAAHRALGVASTTHLDFPAPRLDSLPGYQLAQAIGGAIAQVQPTILYLPHRGDLHADHQRVYLAGLVAARPINHCPVRQVLCYETLSETEWASPEGDQVFRPTVFADISAYLGAKLKAMACYRDEVKTFPHPRSLPALEALAQLRGATVGVTAAEAFALVRQIV
ncbi:PIG-L family deacetylase [Nodosilinea sp. LEGE 07298]|uniref:PIG-L deacetylase family protein n=1 Tax=Nodosilinea sp. LEGE 07298 TaxID=2777970 RepID=UPI0018829421|nr:PIG-L deacetylase family protein [Nodosilinea sp. LEGE 07298]MBE9112022.1 PIG-L family deacetylase [Nodosilinea sp. LEGE 07298]